MRAVSLVSGISIAVLGCALWACSAQQTTTAPSSAIPQAAKAMTRPSSLENGRMIFLSGKDVDGAQITASSHPAFSSCAACHRADGSGGKRLLDGALSADLRHAALVTHQRHPYTLPLLERAISRGVDNEGKALDSVMPRWKLSQRDLHDVAQYVYQSLK